MIVRICVFLLLSATLFAQDGPFFGPAPNREAPPANVSYERLRDANKDRRTGSPTRAGSRVSATAC